LDETGIIGDQGNPLISRLVDYLTFYWIFMLIFIRKMFPFRPLDRFG